jgi:hypothetical protein
LTGIVVGVLSMISSLDEMVDLTNIGTLFAFILVCVGVIVLRYREPNRPRAFKTPGGIVLPVLGVIGCLGLIYYLPPTSWLRFAAWLNVGLVIYVTYGSRESRLTGREKARDPKVHDATTAFSGAWLGMVGSVVTIIACLADALINGLDHHPGWWFPQSPWLWSPLLMNVVIVCPVVWSRASRAMSAGIPATALPRARSARWVAAVQFLTVGAYLVVGWMGI